MPYDKETDVPFFIRRRVPLLASLFVAALLVVPGVAGSASSGGTQAGRVADTSQELGFSVHALQRKLGVKPVSGYYGPLTRRAVKRFQRRKGLKADGIAGPATLRALGIRFRGQEDEESGSVRLPAVLRRIADCESGGNPRAVSPNGMYRGKYQFSRETWRAIGGTGDPAAAPESVQDRLALKLYRREGTSPWPNCA